MVYVYNNELVSCLKQPVAISGQKGVMGFGLLGFKMQIKLQSIF